MIIWGRENIQIICGCDGGAILRRCVTDGGRIFRDWSFLDIITSLSANQETLMTKHSIDVGGRAFQDVEKGSGMKTWLLEMKIKLSTKFLCTWHKIRKHLGSQPFRDLVIQLKFCVENIGSRPGLRYSQTWGEQAY